MDAVGLSHLDAYTGGMPVKKKPKSQSRSTINDLANAAAVVTNNNRNSSSNDSSNDSSDDGGTPTTGKRKSGDDGGTPNFAKQRQRTRNNK